MPGCCTVPVDQMLAGSPSKTSEGVSPLKVCDARPLQPSVAIGSPEGSEGTQRSDWQTPLWQSSPALHACSSRQPVHVVPPQSRSVSSPLKISSSQCASAHSNVASQLRLVQSSSRRHPAPGGQGPHSGPPQSKAVSSPFCEPSAHWGSTHRRWAQLRLTQSPSTKHSAPLA